MKKLLNNKYTYLFIFFLVFLLLQLGFTAVYGTYIFGDDIWHYEDCMQYSSIFEWIVVFYKTWSSRTLIDFTTIIFIDLPHIIFMILNSFVFALSIYSICELFTNNKPIYVIIVGFCMCAFPITIFFNIGWITTCLNYLWPLSLGIYSFILIKDILINRSVTTLKYISYLLALFFASSQELMCLIILCVFIIMFFYIKFIKKQDCNRLIAPIVLSGLMLIYILACPGNPIRTLEETMAYYPDYINYGLLEKISLGFISTTKYLITTPLDYSVSTGTAMGITSSGILYTAVYINSLVCRWMFVSMLVVLFNVGISVYRKNTFTLYDKLSFILFIVIVFLSNIVDVRSIEYTYVFDKTTLLNTIICYVFVIVVVLFYIIALKSTIKNTDSYLLMLLVLSAGFASRLVMGVSPTVFASTDRPSVFIYTAFIIVIVYSIRNIISKD